MKYFCNVILATLMFLSHAALSQTNFKQAGLPDFDSRIADQVPQPLLSPERQQAIQRLRRSLPGCRVEIDPLLQTPKFVYRDTRKGFLTVPDPQAVALPPTPLAPGGQAMAAAPVDPYRPVKRFLADNLELFGHGPNVLNSARVMKDYVTGHNGLRTVVWEQQLDGIPVYGSMLIGHILRNGALVCLCSQVLPDPQTASGMTLDVRSALLAKPIVSAGQAVTAAIGNLDPQIAPTDVVVMGESGKSSYRCQTLQSAALSGPAGARLVWLPLNRNSLRLSWEIILQCQTRNELYRILIDAQNSEVLVRQCLTSAISDATYLVFTSDSPFSFSPGWSTPITNQPSGTNRFLLTLSAFSTNASPNGWIDDVDNVTIGNNVDAYVKWGGSSSPRYGEQVIPPRPAGNPNRVFSKPLDLDSNPTNSYEAAVVQLFYWCNWMHDRLYDLGFSEAAGNFQYNNFGRGGYGGDAVQAEAQINGAGGIFSVPPDGYTIQLPRLQIGRFVGLTRDGSLDAELILHEYAHGLSKRLVGGGGGLPEGATQCGALQEGWSDFYATTLLSQATDEPSGCYAWAAYSAYQLEGNPEMANYYFGFRRYPYSTNMAKNPLTYKDTDFCQVDSHPNVPITTYSAKNNPANEAHNAGELWCVSLWEVRANLIGKCGFEVGNELTLQLITDAMKLSPPSPNFIQARDAILLADRVLTGGTNWNEIWAGFAKRGLGWRATVTQFSSTNVFEDPHEHAVEDFSLPPTNSYWDIDISGSSSGPALAYGVVYVGSSDGHVYAVRTAQENELWHYPSNTTLWGFESCPAAAYEGTLYIGSTNGRLFALSSEGLEKWTFDAGGPILASPAVGRDNTVYFGSLDSNVFAIGASGTPLWTNTTTGPAYAPVVIDAYGSVLVGDRQGMRAIRNGTNFWTSSFCEVRSAPALDPAGLIYVTASNRCLYALHPLTGAVVWSNVLDGTVVSSPVIGNRYILGSSGYFWNVYVGTATGTLRAYRCNNNGRTNIWNVTLPSMLGGLAVAQNEVVFAGGHEAVFLVANGTLISTNLLDQSEDVTAPPLIGPDGTLYCMTTQRMRVQKHLAAAPGWVWPMSQRDARRMGNTRLITMTGQGWGQEGFLFAVENPTFSTGYLYSSEDLTNWQSMDVGIPSLEKIDFLDVSATNAYRFYRVQPQ
jgi:outer membrane protein assembly factor BamB